MSKRNAARISAMASIYALIAIMGETYARAEFSLKQKKGGRRARSTERNHGAFGGLKRSGVKLVRKMMRKAGKK